MKIFLLVLSLGVFVGGQVSVAGSSLGVCVDVLTSQPAGSPLSASVQQFDERTLINSDRGDLGPASSALMAMWAQTNRRINLETGKGLTIDVLYADVIAEVRRAQAEYRNESAWAKLRSKMDLQAEGLNNWFRRVFGPAVTRDERIRYEVIEGFRQESVAAQHDTRKYYVSRFVLSMVNLLKSDAEFTEQLALAFGMVKSLEVKATQLGVRSSAIDLLLDFQRLYAAVIQLQERLDRFREEILSLDSSEAEAESLLDENPIILQGKLDEAHRQLDQVVSKIKSRVQAGQPSWLSWGKSRAQQELASYERVALQNYLKLHELEEEIEQNLKTFILRRDEMKIIRRVLRSEFFEDSLSLSPLNEDTLEHFFRDYGGTFTRVTAYQSFLNSEGHPNFVLPKTQRSRENADPIALARNFDSLMAFAEAVERQYDPRASYLKQNLMLADFVWSVGKVTRRIIIENQNWGTWRRMLGDWLLPWARRSGTRAEYDQSYSRFAKLFTLGAPSVSSAEPVAPAVPATGNVATSAQPALWPVNLEEMYKEFIVAWDAIQGHLNSVTTIDTQDGEAANSPSPSAGASSPPDPVNPGFVNNNNGFMNNNNFNNNSGGSFRATNLPMRRIETRKLTPEEFRTQWDTISSIVAFYIQMQGKYDARIWMKLRGPEAGRLKRFLIGQGKSYLGLSMEDATLLLAINREQANTASMSAMSELELRTRVYSFLITAGSVLGPVGYYIIYNWFQFAQVVP